MNSNMKLLAVAAVLACGSATILTAVSGVPPEPTLQKLGAPEEPPVEPKIAPSNGLSLDGDRRFGVGIAFQNLTVWPVLMELSESVGQFLTLEEATLRNVVEIRESSGGARVSSIEINNRSPVAILVCAGTLIRGGKQDRVIANDSVVAPNTVDRVSVFCVERNRWQDERLGQKMGGNFAPSDTKATKRIRVNAQYKGNQSDVWKQTKSVKRVILAAPQKQELKLAGNQYYLSSTIASGTGSLFNALDKGLADTRKTRRVMAAAVENHLRDFGDKVVGFGYSIDGEPVSVRTFANSELFLKRMYSFISTMCLEAEVAQRCHMAANRPIHVTPAPIEAVLEMIKGLRRAKLEEVQSSTQRRLSKRVNGFGGNSVISVRVEDEKGGHWAELTQDWTAPLEYGEEALQIMSHLQALGYTR